MTISRLTTTILALALFCASLVRPSFVEARVGNGGTLAYQPIPGASPEPAAPERALGDPEDLETFLDGVMAAHLKGNHLAGATVAVVKDGRPLLLKGYGYADVAKRIRVNAETTLFRPGSTSKLFTWTAIMQLVEQGKVDLDEDVNTYLTGLEVPDTFAQPITIRNLLTHTEGMEDGGLGYLIERDPEELLPLNESLALHVPARVRPPTTDFSDGSNASYSNWGTALAGLIVAEVSGTSFDDYVEKHIFEALGMSDSTFREPLPPALARRMATGYKFENGAFKPHEFELISNFGPAGSLTSTAADMAKFMIAHLNGGAMGDTRILEAETAELMHRRAFSPNPHVNGSALGFYETHVNGRRLIGHGGDTLYFHSDLVLLPEENVGLFVSYNTSNGFGPAIARRDLVRAFMDRYFPAALPKLEPPAGFAERAARYAGSYRHNRHSYTRNEKVFALFSTTSVAPTEEGTLLIANLLGPEATQWVEASPSVFRRIDGDETIAFLEGPDGSVTHVTTPLAFIAAYKLSWYETPNFHYFVLGFGALCFVVAIVSAARHWKKDRGAPGGARRARRLAASLGAVQLAFLAAAAASFASGIDELIFGFPWVFRVSLVLPVIAIPLTLGVLAFAASAWARRYWSVYGRIQYTVVAVAGAAYLWSLNFWNLVGFKFG